MPNVLHCRAPPHGAPPTGRHQVQGALGGRALEAGDPPLSRHPRRSAEQGLPGLAGLRGIPSTRLLPRRGLGTSPRSARPPGATAASVAPSARSSLTLLLLPLSPVSFPSTSHISSLLVTADLLCERCYIWTVTRSRVAQNSHLVATPL